MRLGMVPYGYGDITETPTVGVVVHTSFEIFCDADTEGWSLVQIYMLQYFTPEVLGVFVAQSQSYIVGE